MTELARREPPIARMDQATEGQWKRLGEVQRGLPVSDRVICALRCLEHTYLGFPVDQLQHGLQAATRAERDGADTELIVASLCHDIGRVVPGGNHAAVSAALLRPYVRDEVYRVIRAHWAFQLRYTYPYIPGARPDARRQYRRKSWYELAARFADEWDQASFDPGYDTFPLEHFEPMLRATFDRRPPAPRAGLEGAARAKARRARVLLGV